MSKYCLKKIFHIQSSYANPFILTRFEKVIEFEHVNLSFSKKNRQKIFLTNLVIESGKINCVGINLFNRCYFCSQGNKVLDRALFMRRCKP